jgi:hypothetical protein
MRLLLALTAVFESATGVALLAAPALVAHALLGAEIGAAGLPVGRLAGAALLALGVACWVGREDGSSRTLVVAMGVYNVGAVIVLGAAGLQFATAGVVLWGAVVLHAALTVWCGALGLRKAV